MIRAILFELHKQGFDAGVGHSDSHDFDDVELAIIQIKEVIKLAIRNYFIEADKILSEKQAKEVDKKGLWHADLKSLSFNEIENGIIEKLFTSSTCKGEL